LVPAVQSAREAARRMQSMNNLKQLSLAMLNYHDSYRCFPPAVVTDATGKPLYSGRVLLLPFMEQQVIYDQWQKDKPWDSPENQHLSQNMIPTFRDPSAAPTTGAQTDYLFVTGPGTVMEPNPRGMKMADIIDGTSNTLMMVEFKGSGVNWAEPRDFDITGPKPLPPGNHPGGNNVVLYDGSVRFISQNTDPALIHKMATRSGGEVFQAP
jgi:prepilin-type processing-associated H-X9-DG protein